MELKNKVVIVTGASSGIGLATARLFSEKGAKVVLVSRSKDKLNAISKNLENSIVVPADLTKEKDIMNMINKAEEYFGRIDILVNNAGRGYDAPVEKTDIETFRYIFNLDVIGPLIAMQNVIPIMRRNKGGHIINISSGTALMYLPNTAAYSSSKRALASISLTAREELKKDNIIVSVVYPYITLTDFEKNTIKHSVEDEFEGDIPEPDTAEHVANKILEAVLSGDSEIFAHKWMKQNNRAKEEQLQ